MDEEQHQHLNDLRQVYQKRLRILERQEALYGSQTSPQILIEIDDLKRKIEEINKEMERLEREPTHSIATTTPDVFVGKWVVVSISSENGKPPEGTLATIEPNGDGYNLRFWDSPFVWFLSGSGRTISGTYGPRSFSLTSIPNSEALEFTMNGGGSEKRATLKKLTN